MCAPMTEQIFIEGLEIEAIIGVLPHERTTPQPLLIDVMLTTDITTAAQSTRLTDTIDYAEVCEQIKTLCQREEALLLETLADKIANTLFQDDRVSALSVRIAKPRAVADAAAVGVFIQRTRS